MGRSWPLKPLILLALLVLCGCCHCPKSEPLTYEDILILQRKYCFKQQIKVFESGATKMAVDEYLKTGCKQ